MKTKVIVKRFSAEGSEIDIDMSEVFTKKKIRPHKGEYIEEELITDVIYRLDGDLYIFVFVGSN